VTNKQRREIKAIFESISNTTKWYSLQDNIDTMTRIDIRKRVKNLHGDIILLEDIANE